MHGCEPVIAPAGDAVGQRRVDASDGAEIAAMGARRTTSACAQIISPGAGSDRLPLRIPTRAAPDFSHHPRSVTVSRPGEMRGFPRSYGIGRLPPPLSSSNEPLHPRRAGLRTVPSNRPAAGCIHDVWCATS